MLSKQFKKIPADKVFKLRAASKLHERSTLAYSNAVCPEKKLAKTAGHETNRYLDSRFFRLHI